MRRNTEEKSKQSFDDDRACCGRENGMTIHGEKIVIFMFVHSPLSSWRSRSRYAVVPAVKTVLRGATYIADLQSQPTAKAGLLVV